MASPKIVVVGNSYSAAAVFNYLESALVNLREPYDLLLVSGKNHYINNELLSQYLCDSCSLEDTCQWFRGVVFLRPGVSYLEADITNIDFQAKTLLTSKGVINYQYLILAPENDVFEESSGNSKGDNSIVKNLSDVLKLRTKILSNLEKSVFEDNEEAKQSLLSFSVIGSDRQGVQLICSISDFVTRLLKHYYPEIKRSSLKFNLIDENDLLALNKNPYYNNKLLYNLNKKNITLYVKSKVTKIDSEQIDLSDRGRIPSGVTILTQINSYSSLLDTIFNSNKSFKSCNVDLFMKIESFDDVFMIGELANCLDLGEGIQKTNLFYKTQAKVCALNVTAKINNLTMKPFKPDLQMEFLSLGYRNSLLEFKNICIDGIVAWFMHRLQFAFCSLSWKKKLRALVGLTCNILGLSDFEHMNIYELKSNKQALKK